MNNEKILKQAFEKYNYKVWGGVDSPFMWGKSNNNLEAWELFDFFFKKLKIIVIPGVIFENNSKK